MVTSIGTIQLGREIPEKRIAKGLRAREFGQLYPLLALLMVIEKSSISTL